MEFKIVVFNAAKDGKLRRLQVFLDYRPMEEVQMLVSAKTNGATPLMMASKNGHLEVTEYLLERCSANIEQVGSVTFDGDTIEGAPPLWCAAAAGHLAVVKALLKHGANVNSTTKTNSTPLRAACFDGHFEIVKYLVEHGADIELSNQPGHTCLMIACFKGHYSLAKYLVEIGADVNRKSIKGNTALHDCAESGSLKIMKMLLENGARMDVDSYGMTPLLAASVAGHTAVVEHLITLTNFNRQEKVDALELLGATFVDKEHDLLAAFKYWRRAMDFRYFCGEPIMHKPTDRNPVAAYNNAAEVTHPRQLEEMMADPDEMRMQALLVRERILGAAHPDTSYYIRYRGAVYADSGKFERCIVLWRYALEMQQMILEPLNPMTQNSLLSFAELFLFMMSSPHVHVRFEKMPKVDFASVMDVFVKGVRELEAGQRQLERIPVGDRDTAYFNRTLMIVMHLVRLLARIRPQLGPAEDFELCKAVYGFVRLDLKGRNGWTPLHLACAKESSHVGHYTICNFPAVEVVELLMDVGACPNVVDHDGNTPLHVAACNQPCQQAVVSALLRHGAHIDAANLSNKCFLQLLKDTTVQEIVNPLEYLTLQCLAAKAVIKAGIPYERYVSSNLSAFVAIHSSGRHGSVRPRA